MAFVGESKSNTQSAAVRRPRWRSLAILLAIWLALVVVGAAVVQVLGARRASSALERIRASGEPVYPSNIAGATAPGSDEDANADSDQTAAWIARLGERSLVPEELVTAFHSVSGFAGPMRAISLGPMHARAPPSPLLPRLQALPECGDQLAAAGNDVDEFRKAGDKLLLGADELDPAAVACFRSAARANVEVNDADAVIAALEACAIEPLRAARALAAMERRGDVTSLFPEAAHLIAAALTASEVARAEAWAGNTSQCLAALEAGLCTARTIEDMPSLVVYPTWRATLVFALNSIDVCAPRLERGADTSSLQAMLEALDVRSRSRAALVRTRALANRAFERAAAGLPCGDEQLDGQPLVVRWLGRLLLLHQQASYLEEFEQRLLEFDARNPAKSGSSQRTFDFDPRRTLSSESLESIEALLDDTRELEARVQLTRIALTARSHGDVAAQSACESALDPFDRHALRSRVDGTQLVLWSIGRDGVDQGGACEPAAGGDYWPSDLVVRVRLP